MNGEIEVLDHGYIRFVEAWGYGDADVPEAGIIEAARQSTQGSFRGWEYDRKLLGYLHENRHSTPFEFAGLVVEVQAPIFVFREWHRHRVQSYNEMSARYAPLPDLAYVPSVERLMIGGGKNKQAGAVKDAEALTLEQAEQFRQDLTDDYAAFEASYQAALKVGVPKELARLGMPVGRYSRMRASANLRNWLQFVTLRSDPAAQWEIRQYSIALEQILSDMFPETWNLFELGRGTMAHGGSVRADSLAVGDLVFIEGTKKIAEVVAAWLDSQGATAMIRYTGGEPFLIQASALRLYTRRK